MKRYPLASLVFIFLVFSGLLISCEQETIVNEDEINDTTSSLNQKKEVAITISPGKVSLETGKSYQFSVSVSNTSDQSITWKIIESGGGTVTNTGKYTAPEKKGVYHLQVTSKADNSKTATAEISVTSSVFDAAARAKILKDYQDNYLTSKLSSSQAKWTGDVNACKAGATDAIVKQKVLQQINYFRRQVGLPDNIVMNSSKSAKCQEMALMIKANNDLDHSPPQSWSCYTADGATAAGKSNIGRGLFGPRAITAYMDDDPIATAGHRRWIILPKLKEVGTGDTDNSNALWVIGDNHSNYPADMPDFISWPPPGYVPAPLAFYRWSFSVPKAGFGSSKVSVKKPDGAALNVALEEVKNGYGENTLVWKVSGMKWTEIQDEMVLDVSIQNVNVGGNNKNFNYKVVIFKP